MLIDGIGCRDCRCCLRVDAAAMCGLMNRKVTRLTMERGSKAAWCPLKRSRRNPRADQCRELVYEIMKAAGMITGIRICGYIMREPAKTADSHMMLLKLTLHQIQRGADYSRCGSFKDMSKVFARRAARKVKK